MTPRNNTDEHGSGTVRPRLSVANVTHCWRFVCVVSACVTATALVTAAQGLDPGT